MTQVESQTPWIWTPRERNCLSLLQAKPPRCAALLQIHAFMLRNLLFTNLNLVAKLIAALPSADPHGGARHARRLFDRTSHRFSDAFLCNTMMKSHQASRQFSEAIALYARLQRAAAGFSPDNHTFSTLAKCCAATSSAREGTSVHGHVIKYRFGSNMYVATSLVDMYGKLGQMGHSRKVFDEMPGRSPVSWTALVTGDTAAYNAVIDGYLKLGQMGPARLLFDSTPDRNVVSWTAMIDGYCSCGDVDEARVLFDTMPCRNLYSWNAMIGGYSRNKRPNDAVFLFKEFLAGNFLEMDDVTVVSILPAIADLGALDLGNRVREFVKRKKLDRYANVSTALVDMYAKCGEVEKARSFFDGARARETSTWNALINGLALNGRANEALDVFVSMTENGFEPDEITMLGILSACNHGGLVEEGKGYFRKIEEFKLVSKIEHYGCLMDLLGRAGRLEEAERLIESMPYEANEIILSSLLFACGCAKDVGRAEKVVERAFVMEPANDGNYVILRNLYASQRRWRDVERIKRMMVVGGAKKEAGCSAVEVDGQLWEFNAGEGGHPYAEVARRVLDWLRFHMEVWDPTCRCRLRGDWILKYEKVVLPESCEFSDEQMHVRVRGLGLCWELVAVAFGKEANLDLTKTKSRLRTSEPFEPASGDGGHRNHPVTNFITYTGFEEFVPRTCT
ncbi:pentatricopeptide repeat (PPR-like) superfamily protein [Striga asiatica]|uniref:Pentatricopeptide repeat (PPR-like) superfamily protein n=1 Tax=Striga asiatica TaxID=4170 RepID=A0A5A7P466_STRAF|nr:pentatricopeptide repeat (PPR-like) superfamily protein [Striga asiatica]